ncbi:hypothetical protein LguiA_025636 [Lonicera macranthoides]
MESLGVLPCSGSDINQASSNFSEVPQSNMESSIPTMLVSLSLVNCNLSNGTLPEKLHNLPKLKFLYLGGNPICSMPNFIKYLRTLQKLSFSRCTMLEQILWPSINLEELIVTDCISLEKITYETWVSPQYISHDGCISLNYVELGFKIEPLGKVDGDVLDNIGFFDLESMANTEVTIMNIIVHSRLKLPVQIPYENGLNLCLVYTCLSNTRDEDSWSEAITVKINNKSKGEEKQYSPRCWGIPKADSQDLVWLNNVEDNQEGYNEEKEDKDDDEITSV